MGNAMIAKRIQVFGRVQGVGFRWFTCREATRLGLQGWVRNRLDGSVEIHAQGEAHAVQQLESWAQQGPATARVTSVNSKDCPLESLSGFGECETL